MMANDLASLVPAKNRIIVFGPHDDGGDHGGDDHGHDRDDGDDQYAPLLQYGKGMYHNSFSRHLAMIPQFGL
jgi:hypothetical protein